MSEQTQTTQRGAETRPADLRAKRRLVLRPRTVVLASVAAALLLAAAGGLTDICLGDENPHVRHAAAILAMRGRPAYDPWFDTDQRVRIPTYNTPLWHAGLALLWGATGAEMPPGEPVDVSRGHQVLAQAYHAAFYLLGVLCVYFAARRLGGASAATWAWLLVATLPMATAYSVLLFQDVPGLAVAALAVLLLTRRRFAAAGAALAAAYLTKMNMLSFAPWLVAWAPAWAGPGWKRRLRAAVLVAVPVAATFAYDLAWRLDVYEPPRRLTGMRQITFEAVRASGELSDDALRAFTDKPAGYVYWQPMTVSDPRELGMNVGLALLAAAAVALVRAWDRRSLWLWLGVAIAAAAFWGVFGRLGSVQARYLLPVLLPAALLGARALRRWRLGRWARVAIVAACVAQAAGAVGYTAWRRRIPPAEREAYAWLATHATGRVFTPEQAVTNRTGREFVWKQLRPAYFMAAASDGVRRELLAFFDVSHIAVPKRRTYDPDKEGVHAGGFAKPFVSQMRQLAEREDSHLKLAFENDVFVIFRVR